MSRIARVNALFSTRTLLASATAAATLALTISPEAQAQSKKRGVSGEDDATAGQPAAGIAPGAPGGAGRPGMMQGAPGGGGQAANKGPAAVPSFKMEPRQLKGAVTEAPADLVKGAPFNAKTYFGMPAEKDNAGPLVLDALAELPEVYAAVAKDDAGLKERQERLKTALEWFAANPNPRQWDANAVEQTFGPFRVLFAKLHEAHKLPECVIPNGLGPMTTLPHVQAAREAVSLVSPLIFADLARGDTKGAIEKFADALRLSQDIQLRGGNVAGLVVSTSHMMMLNQALPLLLNARLTEKECDQILAALKSYREGAINLLPEMLKTEYLGQLAAVQALSKPGGFKAMIGQLPEVPPQMKGVNLDQLDGIMSALFSPENLEKLRAGMAKALGEQLKAIDGVGSPDDVAKLGDAINQINQKAAAEVLGTLLNKETLANIAAKAGGAEKSKEGLGNIDPKLFTSAISSQAGSADFKPVVNGIVQFQTAQSMMEALTATRRWYITKKATAKGKTLEEIAKEAKLEGAPLDGFSGKPLKMAWIGSGPAVYSVGPDRKDDEAKALFGAVGEDQKASATGDWIVPLALGANPLAAAAAQEGGASPGGPGGGFPGGPGAPGGAGAPGGGPGGRRGGSSGGVSASRPD